VDKNKKQRSSGPGECFPSEKRKNWRNYKREPIRKLPFGATQREPPLDRVDRSGKRKKGDPRGSTQERKTRLVALGRARKIFTNCQEKKKTFGRCGPIIHAKKKSKKAKKERFAERESDVSSLRKIQGKV